MLWQTSKNIILASASPRRKELLTMLGIPFSVIPALTELSLDPSMPPAESVKQIALAKAREVADSTGSDSLIIAADTIVVNNGDIYGKPSNVQNARWMLKNLSGKSHEVYTAIAVISGKMSLCECELTRVHFRNLSDSEITAYLRSGEPFDKAGAYGIQGQGAIFIDRIDGDYYNVVGLPLCRLTEMLRLFDITIS